MKKKVKFINYKNNLVIKQYMNKGFIRKYNIIFIVKVFISLKINLVIK